MSQGRQQHFSVVLEKMTGKSEISSAPLLSYFEPLKQWLQVQVSKNNITVGW